MPNPRTVNALIAVIVRDRFGHLQNAAALEYVNTVHSKLCAELPQLARLNGAGTISKAVTIGDSEFVLANPVINQIDYVTFTPSGGTPARLTPTNVETLNRGTSAINGLIWREAPQSLPKQYYVFSTGSEIRLGLSAPSSVAGTIKIYGQVIPVAFTGSETLPPIPNDQVYKEGVAYHYMLDRNRPEAAMYYQAYIEEKQMLAYWLQTQLEEYQDEATTNVRS